MGALAVLKLFRERVGDRAARVAAQEVQDAVDKIVLMLANRCDALEDDRDQAKAHGDLATAEELDTAMSEIDDLCERIEDGEWRKVKL